MAEHKMDPPQNSNRSKAAAEKKPITPIVPPGEAKLRKPSAGSRLKELFTGDDARSVGSYLLVDVMIPALKNMLADATSQGVERMLFGSSSARSNRTNTGSTRYTAYHRMYRAGPDPTGPRQMTAQSRAQHNFDEVVLPNRGQAEEVLDQLAAKLAEYGAVTVSDFYELVNITGEFIDDNWGWMELRTAYVKATRGGYVISLPRPIVLD